MVTPALDFSTQLHMALACLRSCRYKRRPGFDPEAFGLEFDPATGNVYARAIDDIADVPGVGWAEDPEDDTWWLMPYEAWSAQYEQVEATLERLATERTESERR